MNSFDIELEPDGVRELLNAYLDNEVSDREATAVREALETDSSLVAELSALSRTRNLVRDLPLLDMPPEFAARLARRTPIGPVARPRRKARARALAISAVASIAFWGTVATAGDATAIVPDLASVVGAHASASLEDEHPAADPSVMFTVPDSLEGFEIVYATREGNVAHAMYTNGVTDISVFEQPGRIDWDRVPADGQLVRTPELRGWAGMFRGQHIMMVERRGMVYVLVTSADDGMDEMSEMSSEMPGDSDSLFDQIQRASRRTTEFFGLGS